MILHFNGNQAYGSEHGGQHFAARSSVSGCGGHLQNFLHSSEIGGVGPGNGLRGCGMQPQGHSDGDAADIAAKTTQMLMIAMEKFISIRPN